MSDSLNKIPVSPITSFGNPSVPNGSTFGTNFSILQTGGYMEVYTLSGLTYTILSTPGINEYSGNSIPIQFTKGSGSVFSPDVLTLNSDNISSGRRKLGMLVYVYETDKIYQFNIKNYDTLWCNATGATGPGGPTVVMSDYGTTVKNNSAAGIALINAWTTSTISGVNGYNDTNASWAILQTQSITGGTYFQGNTTFTNSTGGTFNIFGPSNYDPGVISGGTWTDNSNGSINLPQITVALFNNPNFFEPLKFYSIPSGTTGVGSIPALLNNDTNYVIIEYNNGSPRYNVLDNDGTVDWSSVTLYMIIYRADNFVHILEFGNMGSGLSSKMNDRIISTDRFARESGCSLGLSGSTGVVTLSSGVVWNGPNRQIVNGVTSMGLFFKNYHSGGTWVYTTTAHTINNLYYDNGTDLVLATGGKYLVNWYFRGQELNDHLYEVVSSNQYDSVLGAEASNEPNLPELIISHAFLVGRIIIAVSATTGITQSAFTNVFQPSGASGIHNDLIGLQGGLPNEYYHLDSNKYNNLALTNTNNNFSVGQTFLSGLTATTITANNISGTTNYVSKFTGANSLGNSLIYDNGTNVGIGTTSPTGKLDVLGIATSSPSATVTAGDLVVDTANRTVYIGKQSNTSSDNTSFIFRDRLGARKSYWENASSGNISFGNFGTNYGVSIATSTLSFGVTSPARLVVDSGLSTFPSAVFTTGNVGIGITTPFTTLQVSGSTQVGLSSINASPYTNGLAYVNPSGTATSLFLLQSGVASGHVGFRASDNNLYIVNSYTNGSITNPAAITLTSTGNVGIGTTSPTAKLDVQGSITAVTNLAKGVNVSNNLISSATSDVLVGLDIAPNYVGGVGATNTIVGGSSYTGTSYAGVPLTGGTGTGAIATVFINPSGAVSAVTITTAGSGYYLGNVLGTSGTTLGTVGSGFNLTVNTLSNTGVKPIGLRVDGINIGRGGGYVSGNFAMGIDALRNNTIGINNIGIGLNALLQNSNGSQNTAIGNYSLQNNQNSQNTSIGYASLISLSNGSANTSIGNNAGRYIANGSTPATNINNSIFIGLNAFPLADTQTNQIVIGTSSTGLGSNTTVLGNSSTVTTAIYGDLLLGTTSDSGTEKLQVVGSAKISHTGATPLIIERTSSSTNTNIQFKNDVTSLFIGQMDNSNIGIGPSQNLVASSQLTVFGNTGNVIIQNGGTPVDTGYRLDVSGTTRLNGQTRISGTTSAITNLAQGVIVNPTLIATANNDVLVGMDINPTFSGGAFPSIGRIGIKSAGFLSVTDGAGSSISGPVGINGLHFGFNNNISTIISVQSGTAGRELRIMGNPIAFYNSNTGTQSGLFSVNGNFILQNGGTFTDAGYRLDVSGLTRLNGLQTFQGTTASDTAPLGSELATTATGTNWVGTSFALGYTHTTGSTVALTSTLAAVIGTFYQITYTITGRTAGTIAINYGGYTSAALSASWVDGPAASTTGTLVITPTSDFNGTLILSIKTIGTSVATTTFTNSTGGTSNEIRANSSNTNLFMGLNSGRRVTTGTNNTFIGYQAGINTSTGVQNVYIGTTAGQTNTLGTQNTFVGNNSGGNNSIGNYNSFFGHNSGGNNSGGTQNMYMGYNAGATSTSASNNLYFGSTAGYGNLTGGNSVLIGNSAGRYISDGVTQITNISNSVLIGPNTKPLGDSQFNQVVIGNIATGLGSNTTVLGNTSTVTTAIYGNLLLGTTTDNGNSKLQVQGTTASDGPTLGTELATTATGTNWVGTSFALGYTHTTGSTVALTSTLAAVVSTYYQIAYTITGRTAGSIQIDFGGASNSSITATGAWGPLATTTGVLTITPTTDFNGTVVLSVKTIGTSVATTTFTNSSGTIVNEIRNPSPSGNLNLFIGTSNGRRNTTGANNSFIGISSGIVNTTGANNSFLGTNAGAFNTTASNNSFFGAAAGYSNTTGPSNTFIGTSSGYWNTSGGNNSFFGASAGLNNTSAYYNTFIGDSSGLNNTVGSSNTFIGQGAGASNTTGGSNVLLGANTGGGNTAGASNVILGASAGRYIADKTTSPTSIGTSVLIGNRTSPLANTQTNQIVIGNDSTGLGSNTTVLGNSSTITTAIYGDLLLGTTIDSGTEKLQVQGTAGMTAVKIIGSGNSTTPPIFTIQGSQGELFSVNDSLTGSLFSVNDISGLPILEVFSDNTVLMGSYIAPSLNTTTKVTAGVGLTSVYSIPTSAYTGAFFDYTISDNTNLRAGNIMSIWNSGTTVQYSETSTNDIGNTSGLTFNMIISGSTAILRTSGVTGNWTVKTIIRSI